MQLHPLSDTLPKNPSVVTVGTFDGVHLGHHKIIKRLMKIAKEEGKTSCVLTFFPHPRIVLTPDSTIHLLQTIEERKSQLKSLGVEHVVILNFSKEFSELSAEDYIKNILVDSLNASYLIIGYDHKFGKNRAAGIEELKHWSKQLQFKVEEIEAKDVDEVNVSSTKIRNYLIQGNVKVANSYLGYPYYISGQVVTGEGIGKDLGFPTANIEVSESYKLIPGIGVYAVRVKLGNETYKGMLNIGLNPTFPNRTKSIEVNIFKFNRDIYSQFLQISFIERLRDELKFESVEQLQEQLKKDEIIAKKAL